MRRTRRSGYRGGLLAGRRLLPIVFLAALAAIVTSVAKSPAQPGPPATGSMENLSDATRTNTFTDDKFGFGLSDADAKVVITIAGCELLGRADSVVEDGASATASQTASGRCRLNISAPTNPHCPTGKVVSVQLKAVHSINLVVTLPGGNVTTSVTFSGKTESLDIATDLSATLSSSQAPPAGESKTTTTTSGKVNGEGQKKDIKLSGEASTSTEWTQTVTTPNALSDSRTISKTVEKTVQVKCGETKSLPGSSQMALGITSTELTNRDTADFPASAQGYINNKMEVVSATVDPRLPEPILASPGPSPDTQLVAGRHHYLVNAPRALARRHLSPLASKWSVFVPGNAEAVTFQLGSTKPGVARPSQDSLTLPPGILLADFTVRARRPGRATIRAANESLVLGEEVVVTDFSTLHTPRIDRLGSGVITMVKGTSKDVVLNRRPFDDIQREGTRISAVPKRPLVKVVGNGSFKPGQVTSDFELKGIRTGSTALVITNAVTGQKIGVPVRVIPKSAVDIQAEDSFSVTAGELLPLALELTHALPANALVSISSSNPAAVGVVNPSLTIKRGSRFAGYSIQALASGVALIRVTTNQGQTAEYTVTVV